MPSIPVAWWREPTKTQWMAWIAAWLAWMLDVFDFGIFSLLMVAVAKDFGVPLSSVAAILSVTLWTRLVGGVIGGWLADRIGRKTVLMAAILAYSVCNFAAGFSPSFAVLLVIRALFGLGMGAEWPVGSALAMESWPARSRGFMGSMLQAASNVGFILSGVAFALLFDRIGWRGLLMIGVLPALLVAFVQKYVKEPAVWLENRKLQKKKGQKLQVPLFSLFKAPMLGNTLTACWWMISYSLIYYSNNLVPTYLQKNLALTPALVAVPFALSHVLTLFGHGFWGLIADRLGRRWALIMPVAIGMLLSPIYLLSHNVALVVGGFILQGFFAQSAGATTPTYLSERFPTEVRATACAFVYNLGPFVAGFAPLIITMMDSRGFSLGGAILLSISFASVSFITALLFGPETKGKVLDPKPVTT